MTEVVEVAAAPKTTLTYRDVCEIAGITPSSVRRRVKLGQLPQPTRARGGAALFPDAETRAAIVKYDESRKLIYADSIRSTLREAEVDDMVIFEMENRVEAERARVNIADLNIKSGKKFRTVQGALKNRAVPDGPLKLYVIRVA